MMAYMANDWQFQSQTDTNIDFFPVIWNFAAMRTAASHAHKLQITNMSQKISCVDRIVQLLKASLFLLLCTSMPINFFNGEAINGDTIMQQEQF